jgi:two-component sensor histidine kinase
MQVISSMLNLKGIYSKNPEVKEDFLDAANKIQAMSLVHKKLYQSKNLSNIKLKEYVFDLVEMISKSFSNYKIDVIQNIDDFTVLIDIAVPIGLILNELLSNIFKHAFPEKKGQVMLKINKVKEKIFIHIEDNGIGVPEDFDFFNNESLGLQIVISLVQNQLSGEITFKSEKGLVCDICFRDTLYTEWV